MTVLTHKNSFKTGAGRASLTADLMLRKSANRNPAPLEEPLASQARAMIEADDKALIYRERKTEESVSYSLSNRKKALTLGKRVHKSLRLPNDLNQRFVAYCQEQGQTQQAILQQLVIDTLSTD